jgi:hypothetical protein
MTKTNNTLVISQSAPFTVINHFQPSAENQAELVRVLSEGIVAPLAVQS